MISTKIAVLGGSGYTALELIKILLRHPGAELVSVTSRLDNGPKVSELHPSLIGLLDLRCEPYDPDDLAEKNVEFAFCCTPHGTSMEFVPGLLDRGIRVIDLSADYRLHDPELYTRWYEQPHRDPRNLAHAVYGLPEVNDLSIARARLVANPGCYPQTVILGLAPLVSSGTIELTGIIADSLSGVSGAGRTPKLTTHFPECNESITAYAVGSHRHTPEMELILSRIAQRPVEVLFTPHLAPMDRGIFTTIYAVPTRPIDTAGVFALFHDFYRGTAFVRVRESLPATKDTSHSNFLDIAVRVVKGKIIIFVCEDNLIRGASGVAVQNYNLMRGLDERTGLI